MGVQGQCQKTLPCIKAARNLDLYVSFLIVRTHMGQVKHDCDHQFATARMVYRFFGAKSCALEDSPFQEACSQQFSPLCQCHSTPCQFYCHFSLNHIRQESAPVKAKKFPKIIPKSTLGFALMLNLQWILSSIFECLKAMHDNRGQGQ